MNIIICNHFDSPFSNILIEGYISLLREFASGFGHLNEGSWLTVFIDDHICYDYV